MFFTYSYETTWLQYSSRSCCEHLMLYVLWQYYDTLSEALSIVDEEAVTNPVILVHTGVYRDESLFMDYSATVLGAGMYLTVRFAE